MRAGASATVVPFVRLDRGSKRPFDQVVRRYLIGFAVAAIGAGFGWVSYWAQPPAMILGTCDPPVTNGVVGAPAPCVNTVVPLGVGGAIESLVICAALALGIAGLVWLVVSQLPGRRATD